MRRTPSSRTPKPEPAPAPEPEPEPYFTPLRSGTLASKMSDREVAAVLEGVGPGITILRLKKAGQAIQMLSLLYGTAAADGTVQHASGLAVRNLTLDGGQSAASSNPVVGIGEGPSSLDMNTAMGIYASDVVVEAVAFCNYYGAITMGALPQVVLGEGGELSLDHCASRSALRTSFSSIARRPSMLVPIHGRIAPPSSRRCRLASTPTRTATTASRSPRARRTPTSTCGCRAA